MLRVFKRNLHSICLSLSVPIASNVCDIPKEKNKRLVSPNSFMQRKYRNLSRNE